MINRKILSLNTSDAAIQEIVLLLREIFPKTIQVGMLQNIPSDNYSKEVRGVIHLIFPKEKGGGNTACIMITKDGIHYELNDSYGNYWPIYTPKKAFQFSDAEIFFSEIEYFLLNGKVRDEGLHDFRVNTHNSRLGRVIRAQRKCNELESIFAIKTGGAEEG